MNEITKYINNPAVREYFDEFIADVKEHHTRRPDHVAPSEERIIAGLLEDTFEMMLLLQAEGLRTNMGPWWVHPNQRPTKECFDKAILHEVLRFDGKPNKSSKNGEPMTDDTIPETCYYYAFHGTAMLCDYDEVRDSLLPDDENLTYDEIYGV